MARRIVPSPFRCLKFSPPGLLAWFVLIGLQIIKMGVCRQLGPDQPPPGICAAGVPADFYYLLFALLAYSVARVGWVAYHDHVQGAYQEDLAAGRDRYRGRWL